MLIVYNATTLPFVGYPQPAEPVDLLSHNDIAFIDMLCSVKRHAVIDLCTITLTNKAEYDRELASYSSPIMPCFFHHESRSFKCDAGF